MIRRNNNRISRNSLVLLLTLISLACILSNVLTDQISVLPTASAKDTSLNVTNNNNDSQASPSGKIISAQFNQTNGSVGKGLLGSWSLNSAGARLSAKFTVFDYFYYYGSPEKYTATSTAAIRKTPEANFSINSFRASSIQQVNNNMMMSGTVDVSERGINGSTATVPKLESWKNVPATVLVIDQNKLGGVFILILDKASPVSRIFLDMPIIGTVTNSRSESSMSSVTDMFSTSI